MKLITFLIIAGSVALISNAPAGPAVTSGPAQPDSGSGAIMAPAAPLPSGVSPGLNARDSVASQSGADTTSAPSTGSENSAVSSTRENSSANSYSNSERSSTTGAGAKGPSVVDLKQEKVAEVSENELASERANNQKKSEVTKKFESSLLDTGINKITQSDVGPKSRETNVANSATAEQHRDTDRTSADVATKSDAQRNNTGSTKPDADPEDR